jgi:hypothetical protein
MLGGEREPKKSTQTIGLALKGRQIQAIQCLKVALAWVKQPPGWSSKPAGDNQ